MAIVLWNKKYTETLAETLKRFRREKPEFENEKITYAGRLDPMAEGLLILLTGTDVHKKETFLGLSKVYEVSFFFGVTTDTYDILGIPKNDFQKREILQKEIEEKLSSLVGKIIHKYPPYSSKPVQGKPLFAWAREGKLNQIILPQKEGEVYAAQFQKKINISTSLFLQNIFDSVSQVQGDFRQEEILSSWKEHLPIVLGDISLYHIQLHVSSGIYVRSVIQLLAQQLQQEACVFKIRRLQIGDYLLSSCQNNDFMST